MRTVLVLAMLAAVLASALAPAPAPAQVDVTLQVGYRFGGIEAEEEVVCLAVTTPCPPLSANSDDGSLLAATVAFPVASNLAVELHASHQETDLESRDPRFLSLPAFAPDFEVTVLEIGLVRRFALGSWEPFVGGALGGARLSAGAASFFALDDDRFVASAVGGVRYAVGERLGVRVEGRARWLDLPEEVDGDEVTLETSAGLSFRL